MFALLHSVDLFSGQALLPTILQIVYTLEFGILMYLALRGTGNFVCPVLLHETTEPSILLLATYHEPRD